MSCNKSFTTGTTDLDWNIPNFQFDLEFYWLKLVSPRISQRKSEITFLNPSFLKPQNINVFYPI